MKRARPEEVIQRAVASYLDVALPSDAVWWHCPNGGGRSKAEAGALKAQGVKPGIPDVLILWRGRLICIELKAPKNYPAPEQRQMHDRLTLAGAVVHPVARSVGEVADFLAGILPLKARPA